MGARLRTIHHAGLVLFSIWMDVFRAARETVAGVQIQWLCQLLQGAVNLEQASRVSIADVGWFTDTLLGSVRAQRDRLEAMACTDTVLDVYGANARLLPDGPGQGKVFFYDPHAKECTSALKLLKGWCGRCHGVTKVLYLDMIHTVSGFACFTQHYDAYYDLRERTFITLELFDRLFPADQLSGRTFIMDRGIFGGDTFVRFHDRGDYLVTWQKGYLRDGWRPDLPACCFERFRTRNGPDDLKTYRFEIQSHPWPPDTCFRRIIVRATNPQGNTIEVAVLCSNPDMDDQQAVTLIFSRWIQENDFKYLDRHFGLMQITAYATHSYAQIADDLRDRPVDCPEYRELKSAALEEQTALGRLLVAHDHDQQQRAGLTHRCERLAQQTEGLLAQLKELAQALRSADPSDTWMLIAKADKLTTRALSLQKEKRRVERGLNVLERRMLKRNERIEPSRQRLHELREQLGAALRKQSRLQLLIDGCYHRIDVRKKALFDALRITAATMFRLLLGAFRPIYGNHRNDHVLLRQLTHADGFLVNRDGVIRIGLWMRGTYQPWQLRALRSFLNQMTRAINAQFSARRAPVQILLVSSPDDLTSPAPQKPGVQLAITPSVE